jgi:predicted nucleic acid-binding protein
LARANDGSAIGEHTRVHFGERRGIGNLVLQRYYEQGLRRLVNLPLPEAVFLQAARARAQFGLKTPDAIHLAAAQHHRCAALWTNDDRLAQAGHGLAVNILG